MSKIASKKFRRSKSDLQSDELIARWGDEPLEISRGAICHSTDYEEFFHVKKNTWKLVPLQATKFCINDIREFRGSRPQLDALSEDIHTLWNARKPTLLFRVCGSATPATTEPSVAVKTRIADDQNLPDDWRSSPSRLLAKLQDESVRQEELFDAILLAEITAFNKLKTKILLPLLFDFVSSYRLSQDKNTKTAVGAAIRKLAMNLPDSQVEKYAALFQPTETDSLPCEIELELAKAILWRLTAEPMSLSGDFPELENCLAELASDYLTSRLILQKNYASVTLQAILGILLLNSQHADRILQRTKNLNIGWFLDLLQRRIERLKTQLTKIENTAATAAATNLDRFLAELQCASDCE